MERRSNNNWARVLDRAKVYEDKCDLRKSFLDFKTSSSVSFAFLARDDEDLFMRMTQGKGRFGGRPMTSGEIMSRRARKAIRGGDMTPSSRRTKGVGFGGDGGVSVGWESPSPLSRGNVTSPFGTPKSRETRANSSPKSQVSRRSEKTSLSLRRQTFNAPPFSPPQPKSIGANVMERAFTENSMLDESSSSLALSQGKREAEEEHNDPAVSDDESGDDVSDELFVHTYRTNDPLVTAATAEAMSSFRDSEPMSMSALIKTGSLSTLNIEGAGDLRPTNTGRGIRQTLQRDSQVVNTIGGVMGELNKELVGTNNFLIGRRDTGGEHVTLSYDAIAGNGRDEGNTIALSEIQKQRRGMIVGEDVDFNLQPRQKKEMREMIEDHRAKDMIEEKFTRKKRIEMEKIMRRVQAEWMWNLVASKYARILGEDFKAELKERDRKRKENDAARKIQAAWHVYILPMQTAKKKRIQVTLMKFSFRLLARLSRVRLRLAKRKVLKFYSDFSRQRFSFVMVKFRFNCIKLQRRIRSYHQCTKARILVLSMLWNSIEPQIKLSIEKALNAHVHGAYSDKWKNQISLTRFPELATKINSVTSDCVALKKIIQKGVNTVGATLPALLTEEKRLRAEYLKKMGKSRKQSAIGRAISEVSAKSMVPETEKTKVIKTWLTNRRSDHGEYGWTLTRGGKVKATQLNMRNAAKMISGELDIRDHVEYTNNKIQWPTFLMLTDKDGMEEFREVVTDAVASAISRKNNEIQAMVKKRLETEMNQAALRLADLPGGYRWIKEEEVINGGGKKKNTGGKKQKPEVFGGLADDTEGGLVMGSAPIGTHTANVSDKNKRGGEGGTRSAKNIPRRTKRIVEPRKKRETEPSVRKTHALAAPKTFTLDADF